MADDFIESQYPRYVERFPDVFAWQIIRWGVPSVATMRRDRGSGSHAWPGWHESMRATEIFGYGACHGRKVTPLDVDEFRRAKCFAAAYRLAR